MVVTEKFILGKHPNPELCEDGLFISDDFIAVLDGVTSKGKRKFNNMSGGKAATETAIEVIRNAPESIGKAALLDSINKAVASLYDDEVTGESAVCVMVYSKFHKEIWVMGDCQCIINGECHTHEKFIDIELSKARSAVIKNALKNGATLEEIAENDIGRQAIMSQLQEQHQFANLTDHPYGYTVINGKDFNAENIVTYTVSEGDVVIMSTDGYPKLCETLSESEEYLNFILKTDPLCYNEHKSTKGLQKGNVSFDDRAYIKFIV